MKNKKLLLSAIATASLFGIGAIGGTVAFFTSSSTHNIVAKTAKVDVQATIDKDSLKTYSLDVEQEAGKFENIGSTAAFNEDDELVLNNVAPGDKATFDVVLKNSSTIEVRYTAKLSVLDESGLPVASHPFVVVGGERGNLLPDVSEKTINVGIELPKTVTGDELEGVTYKIRLTVEAIQANAPLLDMWDGTTLAPTSRKEFVYEVGPNGLVDGTAAGTAQNTSTGFLALDIENPSATKKVDHYKYITRPGSTSSTRSSPASSQEAYDTALANAKKYAEEFEAIDGVDVEVIDDGEGNKEYKLTLSTIKGLQALGRFDVYRAAKVMLTYDEGFVGTKTGTIFNDYYYDGHSFTKADVITSMDMGEINWTPISSPLLVDFNGNSITNLKIEGEKNLGLFYQASGVENLVIDNAHVVSTGEEEPAAIVARWNNGIRLSNIKITNSSVVTAGTASLLAASSYTTEMKDNYFKNCSATSTADHEVGALAGILNSQADHVTVDNNAVIDCQFTTYDREVGSLFGRYFADGTKKDETRLFVTNTTLKNVTLKITNPKNGITALPELSNRGNSDSCWVGIYEGGYTADGRVMEFDEQNITVTTSGLTAYINK